MGNHLDCFLLVKYLASRGWSWMSVSKHTVSRAMMLNYSCLSLILHISFAMKSLKIVTCRSVIKEWEACKMLHSADALQMSDVPPSNIQVWTQRIGDLYQICIRIVVVMRSFQFMEFMEVEIGRLHQHHPLNQFPKPPRAGGAEKTQPSYTPLQISSLHCHCWYRAADLKCLLQCEGLCSGSCNLPKLSRTSCVFSVYSYGLSSVL